MEKRIVFTDSGDTLVDETTQVFDDRGIVLRAELISGARELLEALRRAGIPVVMVADGQAESFCNVYRHLGLDAYFAHRIYSSDVGAEKPSPQMFEAAMRAMGLTDADKPRILMLGNHVKKDIAGANRFGLTSVLMDWSRRYPTVPETADETPDFVVHRPLELLELLGKWGELPGSFFK